MVGSGIHAPAGFPSEKIGIGPLCRLGMPLNSETRRPGIRRACGFGIHVYCMLCALNFCLTEFTLFCSACSVGYQPLAAILS